MHELHLLGALLRELLVLLSQLLGLFPYELVLLLGLLNVLRHLRPDRPKMRVEVLYDLCTLLALLLTDLDMTLLELSVLALVLTRNLLLLLADHISLGTSVLVLQSLLVVQLLFDLGLDRCIAQVSQ